MYKNIIISIITFLLFFLPVQAASSFENEIRERFFKLKKSFFPGEMYIECRGSSFMLKKNIFGNWRVFWKNELEWLELNIVKNMPAGIVFKGIGYRSGGRKNEIDITQARKNLTVAYTSLPMYKKEKSKHPLEYLDFKQDNTFIPYIYQLDLFSGKMTSSNLSEITGHLVFNKDKYIKEQSIQEKLWLWSESHMRKMAQRFGGKWEKDLNDYLTYESKIKKREKSLRFIINSWKETGSIPVLIRKGGNKITKYCYVLD